MVWEVREQLIAAGKPVSIIDSLFINSIPLHNGTSINDNITIDWLTLNDDNGNINDGTPDYAQINAGCTIKGVPGPEIDFISFSYPDGLPVLRRSERRSLLPRRRRPRSPSSRFPEAARLVLPRRRWRLDHHHDGRRLPHRYTATIPAAECESLIEYYVRATATGGSLFFSPSRRPGESYSALGRHRPRRRLRERLRGPVDRLDRDQRRQPHRRCLGAGQPLRNPHPGEADPAFDGSFCFVTENGNGNFDVDDGCTTLTSPASTPATADHDLLRPLVEQRW